MNIMYLKYFKVVAEQLNMTKAAEQLLVSQSSLSKTIAKIEDEMGVQLFDRPGKRIILNEYGKIFFEYCVTVLELSDQLTANIERKKQEKVKSLRIGSINYLFVKYWIGEYLKSHPETQIKHEVLPKNDLKRKLSWNLIDLAISIEPIISEEIISECIATDEVVLLLDKSHELANRNVVGKNDLQNRNFVALPESFKGSRFVDLIGNRLKFNPNIIFEGETDILQQVFGKHNAIEVYLRSISKNVRFKEDNSSCCIVDLPKNSRNLDIYVNFRLCSKKMNEINKIKTYLSHYFSMRDDVI